MLAWRMTTNTTVNQKITRLAPKVVSIDAIASGKSEWESVFVRSQRTTVKAFSDGKDVNRLWPSCWVLWFDWLKFACNSHLISTIVYNSLIVDVGSFVFYLPSKGKMHVQCFNMQLIYDGFFCGILSGGWLTLGIVSLFLTLAESDKKKRRKRKEGVTV